MKNDTVVIITAGSGMNDDSGLDDFKTSSELWSKEELIELAQPTLFTQYPHKVWGFYGYRLDTYKKTTPHKGFDILLDYVKDKDYFIFTSSVEGQFQKAGFDAQKITECFGSIHYLQCTECEREVFNDYPLEIELNSDNEALSYPLCEECGSVLRPNLLMYNDYDFKRTRVDEQQRKIFEFIDKIGPRKLVVIEVGAEANIPTVRNFSETLSQFPNSTLYRINAKDCEIPDDDGISIPLDGIAGIEKLFKDYIN